MFFRIAMKTIFSRCSDLTVESTFSLVVDIDCYVS